MEHATKTSLLRNAVTGSLAYIISHVPLLVPWTLKAMRQHPAVGCPAGVIVAAVTAMAVQRFASLDYRPLIMIRQMAQ